MQIEFQNIGLLGSPEGPATIDLADFTIITGENNSGKTYATYSLFGLLDGWVDFCHLPLPETFSKALAEFGVAELDLEGLRPKFDEILDGLTRRYCQTLHQVFGAGPEWFSDARLRIRSHQIQPDFSGEYQEFFGPKHKPFFAVSRAGGSSVLKFALLGATERPDSGILTSLSMREGSRALFGRLFPHPHIISSERSGAALFQKELDINKNILTERLQKTKDGKSLGNEFVFEVLQEMASRYALPIRRNIDTIRDTSVWSVRKSFLSEERNELLKFFDEVANGSYKVVDEREIVFLPRGFKKGENRVMLPLFLGSTSVRALLDLHIYLKHLAQPGDMLLMDEPELNLHPENQRKMARLLVRLVNAGVRVYVTTHSDYLIKEVNNLMMWYRLQTDPNSKTIGYYDRSEALDPARVRLYQAEAGRFTEAPKDHFGFVTTSFDSAIEDSNAIQDALTARLENEHEHQMD